MNTVEAAKQEAKQEAKPEVKPYNQAKPGWYGWVSVMDLVTNKPEKWFSFVKDVMPDGSLVVEIAGITGTSEVPPTDFTPEPPGCYSSSFSLEEKNRFREQMIAEGFLDRRADTTEPIPATERELKQDALRVN